MKSTIDSASLPAASAPGASAAATGTPTRRHIQQFEALLNPLWGPQMAGTGLAPTQQAESQEEPTATGGFPALAPQQEPEGMPAQVPAPSDQATALRVSSGPLAGLVVRAFWREPQLQLRLETLDAALGVRLNAQRQALAAALEQALGVAVTVAVQHDGAI